MNNSIISPKNGGNKGLPPLNIDYENYRPYDEVYDMYYDEFEDASPDDAIKYSARS